MGKKPPGGQNYHFGVTNLTLGNAAYRRANFEALDGFPVGYFPQEDQIFHEAACHEGMQIRFDPQIVVAQGHRTEANAFLKHQHHIGKANARVVGQLNMPGVTFVRYPWLGRLLLPALAAVNRWKLWSKVAILFSFTVSLHYCFYPLSFISGQPYLLVALLTFSGPIVYLLYTGLLNEDGKKWFIRKMSIN